MSCSEIALYVHWPFCVSKCPYCDFNSHVRTSIDQSKWRRALLKDLDYMGQRTKGRILKSVFFGGGTPSLMPPDTVKTLLDQLSKYWKADALEITLEANPNSVEINKFKEFKKAGVNRVSLGIQSLDTEALHFLGRTHSLDEAYRAIQIAADTFDRYSFDLIYARPNQSVIQWEEELSKALELVRDHISLYQLTIEPGTAFHTAYQRKSFNLPEEGLAAEMYSKTNEILKRHGLERYEVSNHAKKGQESQHNLVYWRYQDYIGIGPGAHGRVTLDQQKVATQCYRAPETWLEQVELQGHGIQQKTSLSQKEQTIETIMMGLRLKEGIGFSRFAERFQEKLLSHVGQDRIAKLATEGYLEVDSQGIRVTVEGMLRLTSVTQYILESLEI